MTACVLPWKRRFGFIVDLSRLLDAGQCRGRKSNMHYYAGPLCRRNAFLAAGVGKSSDLDWMPRADAAMADIRGNYRRTDASGRRREAEAFLPPALSSD